MKSAKTFLLGAAACAFFLAGQNVLAHSDEYHDAQKAPHGGQLRMAGAYHFELVLAANGQAESENPLIVYVTDHAGAAMPTAGATGTVTLLSGKGKVTATLTPDGGNRMKGVAKYAATPDAKAVVSITLAGKTSEQARFAPLATGKGATLPPMSKTAHAH